jgi:iron complex outermembrane recepter protein
MDTKKTRIKFGKTKKFSISAIQHLIFVFLYFNSKLFIPYFLLSLIFFFAGTAKGQNTDTIKYKNQTVDTTEYKTETIEVDALRGNEKLTPITYENVKRETIEKRYWMQDLPMFLNGNTNVVSYSESGSSIGYTYFTIRGFDQRRISVLLNGTPQNDAEDHQVNWVELSDIMSSVENIQMQRGIGTILYGTSGIGGVINVQTIDYFKNKFLNLNAGYGDYNSSRYSLEYSTGLTQNGFGFYGKFSKSKTDGYRNLSWSDHWSYFLSAGKMLSYKSVIKLNVYGSPNKNHFAYQGVTKDYLDGKITGDARKDRTYNPLEASNETDNNLQPHYELIYNFQANKNLFISNTFNYIRGEREYTTNYPVSKGYDFSYYHLPVYYVTDSNMLNPKYYERGWHNRIDSVPGKGYKVVRCDMVVNIFNNSNDYGWYPKLQWKHFNDKANLVAGGEFRLHNSEHFGEISFGTALPSGTQSGYRYYFYNGGKKTYSIYLNEFSYLDEEFSVMAGAQFTFNRYSISNNEYEPYNFDVDYKFLTSRVGLGYDFSKNLKLYASICSGSREPRLKDIYDADNLLSKPYLHTVDTVNNIYSDPLVQYEELTDYELGIQYSNNILKANVNLYLMDYTNEIVSNGQLDNSGEAINWNAGKTIHRGIEFEFEYNLFTDIFGKTKNKNSVITLNGNLSLSKNFFDKYIEKLGTDTLGNVIYGNDYSGNRILLTPEIIGNLSLNYNSDFGFGIYIAAQYVGKQYLDNSENEKKNPSARLVEGYVDKIINPYTVFNAGVTMDFVRLVKSQKLNKYFKSLEASLRINNIFDRLYETYGGVDSSGTPNWIPAADRNIFFNLKMGF